ncbi:MAG: ParB/RepB/Spo0J family partition protein [Thermoguttaceae bacterium]
MGASAAVNRVAGIASGSTSDEKRSRPLPRKPPGQSARVSAQQMLRKNLPAPVRAVTSYSCPRIVALINDSVHVYAVRLYGEFFNVNRDGDGGAKAVRRVAAGFHLGARKYVAAHSRPLSCGLIVVLLLLHVAQRFFKTHGVRITGNRERAMKDWTEGEIRWIALETIGERYRRYRLPDAAAEAAMMGSLSRYGQLSPLAVCLREEKAEVLDGFKRVAAARTLPAISSLQARLVEVDEPTAKAIILGLNGIGGRMKELEEAWIVQALVREDGLSQLQVAELLQRHKSWVCRRLALLERLAEECREDLRLGLLSPTMARQLTRLPAGNQVEVVAAARREHLTAAEMHGMVDLIVACTGRPQVEFILHEPRRALRQAQVESLPAWDPRLSAAGNRVLRQLGHLLDGLGRMENWLRHKGRADLAPCDRGVLSPSFGRLGRDARSVAELTEDLLTEIDLP